jgi:hypothetical protein
MGNAKVAEKNQGEVVEKSELELLREEMEKLRTANLQLEQKLANVQKENVSKFIKKIQHQLETLQTESLQTAPTRLAHVWAFIQDPASTTEQIHELTGKRTKETSVSSALSWLVQAVACLEHEGLLNEKAKERGLVA